jgi:hypothetical protein
MKWWETQSILFCYKFYLIIKKLKTKFLVGEKIHVLVLQNYMNT